MLTDIRCIKQHILCQPATAKCMGMQLVHNQNEAHKVYAHRFHSVVQPQPVSSGCHCSCKHIIHRNGHLWFAFSVYAFQHQQQRSEGYHFVVEAECTSAPMLQAVALSGLDHCKHRWHATAGDQCSSQLQVDTSRLLDQTWRAFAGGLWLHAATQVLSKCLDAVATRLLHLYKQKAAMPCHVMQIQPCFRLR